MINWENFSINEKKNLSLLNSRGKDYGAMITQIKTFVSLRKKLLLEMETLLQQKKIQSQKFVASSNLKTRFLGQSNKKITQILKETLQIIERDLKDWLCRLPNVPDVTTPLGLNSNDNIVLRSYKTKPLKINNLSHDDILQKLDWINTTQAVNMSQTRTVIYKNDGAKLLRILINFMLDQHRLKNYQELVVPHMTKASTLWGTAQFPKMQDDCYQIAQQDLFLIPTTEVPLVNFYRDHIISDEQLPIKLCAYSRCFRRESGAAGKDTRGIIRLHEFHKIELVQIVNPETSHLALETMLKDSTILLEMLNIPYRVLSLCRGDLSFSSSKTYDVEVWMPHQQKYLEIASISNTTDFQSSYLKIRSNKKTKTSKKQLLHTLNGSALAIDRLIACLLEHYYDSSKNIFRCPKILQKYWTLSFNNENKNVS